MKRQNGNNASGATFNVARCHDYVNTPMQYTAILAVTITIVNYRDFFSFLLNIIIVGTR